MTKSIRKGTIVIKNDIRASSRGNSHWDDKEVPQVENISPFRNDRNIEEESP